MKKVYVLVAASLAAFGAVSAGSMTFASVPSTDDSVPATDPDPTDPVVTDPTTTIEVTTTSDAATTSSVDVGPTSSDAVTTSASVDPSSSVEQLLPTSSAAVTPTSVGTDGLLPNTGGDIAIPLVLAGLAAGTGAATLLVRRRSNAS